MIRISRLLVAALVAACAATQAAAQSLVIENARVLDGRGGVIERGTITVRSGKILSVSAAAPVQKADPGVRTIDAKGMTVMPGFIDSHRHPIGGGAEWLKTEAAARMQEFLDAGFTTLLSAGDDINTAIALRDQIAKGAIKGPRLIVLGRVPTAGPAGRGAAPPAAGRGAPFGGRGDPARTSSRVPPIQAAAAIPPEQTIAAVAAMGKAGVDGLKTNIVVSPGGPEVETLSLIAREAKKFNLPVITHAVSVDDTLGAVAAGVTSLAHTPHIGQLTLEQAQKIAKSGIPMMSTLGVFVPHFDEKNTPLFRDRLPFPWETASSGGQGPVNARLLWEAGIVYGYGTDTSWLPKDSLALELRPLSLMFSPRDIVSILTKNAAAAVLRSDSVGTLEPGKDADIVILNGDPLANVSNLLNVAMVIKGGVVVVEKR